MIPGYGAIYQLGHPAVASIFAGPVTIEEKIDGSQISFGVSLTPDGAVLRVRSKGAELNILAPDKLFAPGVAAIQDRMDRLRLGWVYRGEYLAKPKHNTLAYDRIPRGHIAVFDIDQGEQTYLSWAEKAAVAAELEWDVVPLIHLGHVDDVQRMRQFLGTVSGLGGQTVEGLVVKNYAQYGPDRKVLMAKFVSEAFKEVHGAGWKTGHPAEPPVVDILIERYRTPARWMKAVQHLREAGQLEGAPQDIGKLMLEVARDVAAEEAGAMKEALYEHVWPKVRRGLTAGLPAWYKEQLLLQQPSANPGREGDETPPGDKGLS